MSAANSMVWSVEDQQEFNRTGRLQVVWTISIGKEKMSGNEML